jgi:hypothetical protein
VRKVIAVRAATGGVVVAAPSAAGVGYRVRRTVLALLLVAAAACGGEVPAGGTDGVPSASVDRDAASAPATAPPVGRIPAAESLATSEPGTPAEHERFQQLRVETLRLMIQAAQRALPVGPFQERIDAASRTATSDVAEAADRMEEIVADLEQAIADDESG